MEEDASPSVDDLFSDCGLDDYVQQPEPSVPFVGLWNLGNSCFLNSVLQVLFFCPGFQRCLEIPKEKLQVILDVRPSDTVSENDSRNEEVGKKCKLLLELQNLFGKMRESQNSMVGDGETSFFKDKAVQPSKLMDILREIYPVFEPYTQQDAQECLRCILDILHEVLVTLIGDVNPQTQNRKPAISDLSCKVFGGRNSGGTCLIPKSSGKSQLENRDPSRSGLKQSRSTAARKRGVREVLKNLSRPKVLKPETKYKPLMPLGENKSSRKLTPSETAALVTENSASESEEHSEPQSSHLPPLKKKKLAQNDGIPKFYKPSAFSNVESSTKYGANRGIKLASTFKAVLKPSNGYKKFGTIHSFNENELVNSYPEKTLSNFIDDLFQGQLINEVRCLECENSVQRTEDFLDISLPVKETKTAESYCGLETAAKQSSMHAKKDVMDDDETGHCSVTWGLSSFTAHEILEGENKYYCGKCLRHAEGERRILLHRLPPVLTFHLKRFSSSKDTALQYGTSVSKINSCLNVPLELYMEKWCSQSQEADLKYTLFGIIVHSGASICSGHYLAYVRVTSSDNQYDANEKLQEYSGKWLEADDDRMRILDEKEMEEILSPKDIDGTSRTPYLLFYQKGAT